MKTNNPQNKQETTPRLDTPKSLAQYVGVTPACIVEWCNKGIIPVRIRAGRTIRFDRNEALKALEGKQA
jgi:hypothetical protein